MFGSKKHKANIPFGADDETHRLDKVSYSRPRIEKTVTRARAKNLSTTQEEDEDEAASVEPPNCAGPNIQCVIVALDTRVNERL